jgi:phosphoribosylaminoimidazolecarboxamide formyltransferase/IMP cyclohydrolase
VRWIPLTAAEILKRQFVEVVIAPAIDARCPAALRQKAECAGARLRRAASLASGMEYKRIAGGLLVQDADSDTLGVADFKVVSQRAPSTDELRDLQFAWKVAMYVKSNAIVYAKRSCRPWVLAPAR